MSVLPGDVLLTRTGRDFWARVIRFGAALRDEPNPWNHVIVASHTDSAGTFWGIEGRPGGVGWVDVGPALADRWTVTNADQPKTGPQRQQVVAVAKSLLGTPYDWGAIAADAMAAIGASRLWRLDGFDNVHGVPAHLVCSSLAAWVYEHVGLAEPGPPTGAQWRTVTPADWAAFIVRRAWSP